LNVTADHQSTPTNAPDGWRCIDAFPNDGMNP